MKKTIMLLFGVGAIGVICLFLWHKENQQRHLLTKQVKPVERTSFEDKPTDTNYQGRVTVAVLGLLAAEIRVAYSLNGVFPRQEGNLRSNLTAAGVCKKAGPIKTPIEDYWGTPIKYSVNATTAVLSSAGFDQKFGTQDDISDTIIVHDGTNTFWGAAEIGVTLLLYR